MNIHISQVKAVDSCSDSCSVAGLLSCTELMHLNKPHTGAVTVSGQPSPAAFALADLCDVGLGAEGMKPEISQLRGMV